MSYDFTGGGKRMAKYGLFSGSNAQPDQTFEGDRLIQNGDHVYIHRKVDTKIGRVIDEQVAAIKLAEGQCVKEISG